MKLERLVDMKIGFPLERKKASLVSHNKIDYRVLILKSFANINYWDKIPYDVFTASSEINSQYLTKANDIIVRIREPYHAILINENNTGLLVPSLMVIITNIYPDILSSAYLAYLLNSSFVHRQYNMQGTLIQLIKLSDLRQLQIDLPTLEEQQRIVKYFELANKEIYLLEQLVNQKKALNNIIFNNSIQRKEI
jgi:restriction endonuclease S subunit